MEQHNHGDLPYGAERSFIILEQETDMLFDAKKYNDFNQGSAYDSNNKVKINMNRMTNSSSSKNNNQLQIQDVDRISMRDIMK